MKKGNGLNTPLDYLSWFVVVLREIHGKVIVLYNIIINSNGACYFCTLMKLVV